MCLARVIRAACRIAEGGGVGMVRESTVQHSNCGRGSQTSAIASEPRAHGKVCCLLRPLLVEHIHQGWR